MPTFISTKPSSGVCTEKKRSGSSPRASRSIASPASTIIPAIMPPKKRYTGISQPHACSCGSTSGFMRVEVISNMAVASHSR